MMDGAKNFYFSTSQVVQRWCKNYVRYIDRTFAHTLSRSLVYATFAPFCTLFTVILLLFTRKLFFKRHFEKYWYDAEKKKKETILKLCLFDYYFFFTQILLDLVMFELSIKESIRKLRRDCCCLTLIKSRCMRIYIYIFSEKSFFALLYL